MITRALAAVLLIVLGLLGLQTHRLAAEQADHAATRIAHAEQLARQQREALEALAAVRVEEQRRTAEVQKAADDAQAHLDRARADAAAAADAGQRLRDRIAALTASCRAAAGHPCAAGAGAPADATGDLLADVQRRLDEAADGIARHADETRAAGTACQRSYESLR